MIAKERSLIHIYTSVNLLNKILLGLLGLVFCVSVGSLISLAFKPSYGLQVRRETQTPSSKKGQYDLIGSGPLSIQSELQSFPFPNLTDKIVFLSKTSRPDILQGDEKYLLGLKGTQNRRVVSKGEKVFLSYEKDQLAFSESLTPLWIKVLGSQENGAHLILGIELSSDQGKVTLSETREHFAKVSWSPLSKDEITNVKLLEGVNTLESAKWWPADRLFDAYAGSEFEKFKGLERLETEEGEILFVDENTSFVWKEGQWVEGAQKGFPLAVVEGISPYKMEWAFWDSSGIESYKLTFHREKPGTITTRAEEVFTRLRQRTSTRVSCRLENRATILKVGDWLIQTDKGWHTIKNSHEIDDILNLKVLGELFIFDSIEDQDGKEVFCGTLFDPMRTEVQTVRLPISQMKNLEHSPPLKRGLSSKIRTPALVEQERSLVKLNARVKMEPIEECEIFEE